MTHHEKDDVQHDDPDPDTDRPANDGSTANPNTELTSEDEQDTVSGGAPERPE
jgi:hypothetical protein